MLVIYRAFKLNSWCKDVVYLRGKPCVQGMMVRMLCSSRVLLRSQGGGGFALLRRTEIYLPAHLTCGPTPPPGRAGPALPIWAQCNRNSAQRDRNTIRHIRDLDSTRSKALQPWDSATDGGGGSHGHLWGGRPDPRTCAGRRPARRRRPRSRAFGGARLRSDASFRRQSGGHADAPSGRELVECGEQPAASPLLAGSSATRTRVTRWRVGANARLGEAGTSSPTPKPRKEAARPPRGSNF
jgi:hypothetical protein